MIESSTFCGSSPRVRGTPKTADKARVRERFIPASAGNARVFLRGSSRGSVHPRECGERGKPEFANRHHGGSSPRVRGTHQQAAYPPPADRFIPASAGNAACGALVALVAPVHPRECGERLAGKYAAQPTAGSSPRVRGTHHHSLRNSHAQRFIPASAGNAFLPLKTPPTETVHPRECGERRPPGE